MLNKVITMTLLGIVASAGTAQARDTAAAHAESCDVPEHTREQNPKKSYSQGTTSKRGEAFLRAADRDGDGKVTRDEWHAEDARVRAREAAGATYAEQERRRLQAEHEAAQRARQARDAALQARAEQQAAERARREREAAAQAAAERMAAERAAAERAEAARAARKRTRAYDSERGTSVAVRRVRATTRQPVVRHTHVVRSSVQAAPTQVAMRDEGRVSGSFRVSMRLGL